MSGKRALASSAERAAVASTALQLAALEKMSVGELAEKYREVFGEPTRTRNKEYLRKRIAWRIQELTEGGLSTRALKRIEQLAPEAPVRWRQPVARKDGAGGKVVPITRPARDPRLPPAGTVITRLHDGVEHKVTILDDGFEYGGERHRSLSKVARLITGTPWNGFLFFFGRANGTRPQAEEGAA
ncbi:MAG: DUF2924 domain-containing protein [Myxococcales bacterium]|nr:DUF2924 domain-containing protein [Myxococcales bacterium]